MPNFIPTFARLLQPADYLVAALGLALVAGAAAYGWFPVAGVAGDRVRVRVDGRIADELPLAGAGGLHRYRGPLGETAIRIESGRVRVEHDPGPRQLCVQQGWLERAGDAAWCLPNHVGIEVLGHDGGVDSHVY